MRGGFRREKAEKSQAHPRFISFSMRAAIGCGRRAAPGGVVGIKLALHHEGQRVQLREIAHLVYRKARWAKEPMVTPSPTSMRHLQITRSS